MDEKRLLSKFSNNCSTSSKEKPFFGMNFLGKYFLAINLCETAELYNARHVTCSESEQVLVCRQITKNIALHDYKMLDKLVCSYQNPVFVPPVNNNCWATDLNMRALTILKLASMRRHAPGQEPCVVQSECNLVFVNHWVKSNRCYHSKDRVDEIFQKLDTH